MHLYRQILIAACALPLLAACADPPPASLYHDAGRATPQKIAPRPDYPGYGRAIARQPIPWTAESLADDFIDLQFQTEWGSPHKNLLRWPGPVDVALVGPELAAYRDDVAALLDLIGRSAPNLRLRLTDQPEAAEIAIRTAPKAEMKEVANTALCFFAPVAMDWEAYKTADAKGEASWDGVEELTAVTVFIPETSAPHVFRICFIEEIMQALGPGNDLYRLEDSGFNDDEVHVSPTAFDLLMLRVLYDPALQPGMSKTEARAAATAVLQREIGSNDQRRPRSRTDHDADFQIYHYYSDVRTDPQQRRELLDLANKAAAHFAPDDHRLGEALRSEAYFASDEGRDGEAVRYARLAVAHFERTLSPTSARLARTRADLGLFLLLDGSYVEAASAFGEAEPWLAAHAKEDDLANVMRLRAIALAQSGRSGEARKIAQRALAWAAYVFGADSRALSEWRKQFRDFEIAI